MASRIDRRQRRFAEGERNRVPRSAEPHPAHQHPPPGARHKGSDIPADLQRQWIQGTGPAARPQRRSTKSIRNVAYALLSGADGWMFDGEDALGQIDDDVARQPAQPEAGDRIATRCS